MNPFNITGIAAALALATAIAAPPVLAQGSENEIKKAVEAVLGKGAKVDDVRSTGILGLYEVRVGGEILYTDKKAAYLFSGDIIESKTHRNITEERKNKLSQIKFSDLPLELAAKQVRGNGKRVIATFEDPNCGYCRKLAKELQGVTDITVYTYFYPVLGPDSEVKAKNLWCAPDKMKAWNELMLLGVAPPQAPASCDISGLEKVKALGQRFNIRGTPALFFTDGSRIPGFVTAPQLEQTLAKIGG